ncbi:MAG: Rieske 2Fe-2S domain-containing protein [Armatimonadetes bacterium]|nr:Rieske 2Fe-2S domain-containing protein [Armatimonadota bacterium]
MKTTEEPGGLHESRRRFLSWLSGVITAIIALLLGVPLLGAFIGPSLKQRKEKWVALGPVRSLPDNMPTRFKFSYQDVDGWRVAMVSGTAYAVQRPKEKLYVLSNICTHLGCPVKWDDDARRFLCPCHAGVFDIEGNVISGPPPRPLDRYRYRVEEGVLQILIGEA